MKSKLKKCLFRVGLGIFLLSLSLGIGVLDVGAKAQAADDTDVLAFDFDGVEITTDYNYKKTTINPDNIFNLFAGKTGEGKCMAVYYQDNTPITFTLSEAIKAEDYEEIDVSICVSNWVGGSVTTTAYSVTDTGYTTPAGSVKTAYGNQTATLVLDTAKLADADGMIKQFVIVPTFTNITQENPEIQCLFDDFTLVEVINPLEDGIYDFDGAEITTDYNYNNKTTINPDNVFNLFAGKTGEGKCTTVYYQDNTPVTFTLNKAIKAEDYSEIAISFCTSNWVSGNVTTTAYSIADTGYTTPAGSVNTAYGNQTATLSLAPAKLADADGMIKQFVIIPTFTNVKGENPEISCFFDDLTPVEAGDPLEDGTYDFDGAEIKTDYNYNNKTTINPDNVFNLFAGKTGEGKCMAVFYQDNTPITFTLNKAIKAEDYSEIAITICTSNWVSGNITTTAYSIADTGYTTPAGSVNTAYGNKTATLSLDPTKLADADGMIKQFVIVPTFTNITQENPDIQCFFDDFILKSEDNLPQDDYSSKVLLAGDLITRENPKNIQDDSVVWGALRKHGLYEPYGATESNAFIIIDQKTFPNFETYNGGSYDSIRAKRIALALDVGNLKAEYYAQFQIRVCFTDWNFGKHQFYIYGSGTTAFTDENGDPTGYAMSFKTSHPSGVLKLTLNDLSLLADENGNIQKIYIVYWGNVTDKKNVTIGCMDGSSFWVSDLKFTVEEDVQHPTVSQQYIEKDIAEILPTGNGATFESAAAEETKPLLAAKTKSFDVLNVKMTVNYTDNWAFYFLMKAITKNSLYQDGGIIFWFSNEGVSIGFAKNGNANLTTVQLDELPQGTFASGQSVDVRMAMIPCYLEGVQCGYEVALYLNGAETPALSKYFENGELTLGQYTNVVFFSDATFSLKLGAVKEGAPTAEEIMDVGVYTASGETEFLKARAALALEYFEFEGNVVSDLVIVGDATYDPKTKFLTFNSAGSVTVYFEVTNAFGTFKSNELTISYVGEGDNKNNDGKKKGCKSSMDGSLVYGLIGLSAIVVLAKKRRKED